MPSVVCSLRTWLVLFSGLLLVAVACEAEDEIAVDEPDDEEAEAAEPEDEWPEEISFAVTPDAGEEGIEDRYGGLLRYLSAETGINIEFRSATDYAGVAESIIAGDSHLAHGGAFMYVIARDQGAPVEPVGVIVSEPGGEPDNKSLGVRRAGDDHIETFEDVAEHEICFIDPGSTTGYLYPAAEFLDAGIDPEETSHVFTGDHEGAIESLVAGDCDVAYTYRALVEEVLPREGLVDPDEIEVFWENPVETGGLYMSTEIPESLQERIEELVTQPHLGRVVYEEGHCEDDHVIEDGPEGEPVCELGTSGEYEFYPVDDSYFDDLRFVCEQTGAPACE